MFYFLVFAEKTMALPDDLQEHQTNSRIGRTSRGNNII